MQLLKAKYFTTIDIHGAYNLVRMAEGEEWKMASWTGYGVGEQERGHRVKILLGKWKGQNPTQSVYRSGRKKVERGSRSCVFVGGCPLLSCNKKELFIHGAKFPSHTLALP